MKFTRFIIICCSLAALAGCASANREPGVIIIRNGTDQTLSILRVHEVKDSPLEAQRFGQFTGVPPHANQRIGRRPNPPPLPEKALVTWQAVGGPKRQQQVDLLAAARSSDTPGGILIIEVLPNNTARAYVVPMP